MLFVRQDIPIRGRNFRDNVVIWLHACQAGNTIGTGGNVLIFFAAALCNPKCGAFKFERGIISIHLCNLKAGLGIILKCDLTGFVGLDFYCVRRTVQDVVGRTRHFSNNVPVGLQSREQGNAVGTGRHLLRLAAAFFGDIECDPRNDCLCRSVDFDDFQTCKFIVVEGYAGCFIIGGNHHFLLRLIVQKMIGRRGKLGDDVRSLPGDSRFDFSRTIRGVGSSNAFL